MASGVTGVTQGVKVAVFMVILVVAGWLGYRQIAKDARPSGYSVYVRLDDASGLIVKSRVRVAGIAVGYIDRIDLDGDKAKVVVRVDKGVALHTDAAAGKRAASLLGEQVLVFNPGSADLPVVGDGAEIRALASAGTDKIMADLATIAEKVKAVSVQAAGAFGTEEGGKQMKDILKNLAEVSKEINETVKENRKAVSTTITNIEKITNASVPKVTQILVNVENVTKDLQDLLEKDKLAKAQPGSTLANVKETVENLKSASKNLDATLKHTENITSDLQAGKGTAGKLLKDENLASDVEGVVSDIREFTGGISRVRTIVGLRAEYLIGANGFKSTLDLRLQPREDKYYLIEIVTDPRGVTTVTQVDTQSTDGNKPALVRELRTETKIGFRFSFMFARRFGPATFMFGVRESTGGLGLILHGFDDRLELRTDVFGFGENVRPRWREHLGFEFVKRMWLVAGVDDIVNADRRDYFFGGQLRFDDEDLKSILPFATIRP